MADYKSRAVVLGRAFADSMLNALSVVPGAALLATGKVRLSKNAMFNPSPDDLPASYAAEEADFSGYTAGGYAMTLSPPLREGPYLEVVGARVLIVRSALLPGVNNSVYGYWVEQGAGLVLAERFYNNTIVPFGNPGDFLSLLVQFPQTLTQLAS